MTFLSIIGEGTEKCGPMDEWFLTGPSSQPVQKYKYISASKA
jgi:hypothetical protein